MAKQLIMGARSHRLLVLAVLIFVSFGQACKTIIQAKRLVPARQNIAQLEKIAFAGFTGFDPHEQQTALQLNRAIRSRLADNPFLQVTEADFLISREGYPKKLAWQEKWRRFGEEQGAPAIFGGEIDLAEERAENASHRGAIVLMLRLIDTATGRHLIGTRLIVKAEADGQARLWTHLIEQMAESAVRQISPQIVEQPVEFLKTKRTQEGLLLAEEGEWAGAIAAWGSALEVNSDDQAAHFNIGAAHEFLGALDLALDAYQRAHEVKPGKLTRLAISRVSAARAGRPSITAAPQNEQSIAPIAPSEIPSTEASSPTH